MNNNSISSQNFSSFSFQLNQIQENFYLSENPNKESKTENQGKVVWSTLPKSLWSHTASFLPLVDLIAFETTSKENIFVTQLNWKYLCQKDMYNFTWGACEKEKEYKQKWNYCLTKCLIIFSEKILGVEWALDHGRDDRSQLNERFKVLWEKFPSYGNYFKLRLYEPKNTMQLTPDDIMARMQSLSKIREGQLKISNSVAYGGESLLSALYEIFTLRYSFNYERDLNKIFRYFRHAVVNGATMYYKLYPHAEIIRYFTAAERDKFMFYLALVAMKKGDWHPLEQVPHLFTDSFIQEHKDLDCPAPILVCFADNLMKKKKYEQANELLKRALIGYGPKPPPHVLYCAANVKHHLDQLTEADDLISKALEAYNGNPPDDVLEEAGDVKRKLHQFIEADKIYAQAFALYEDDEYDPPGELVANRAFVNFQLKQFVKADGFYTQARTFYKNIDESIPAIDLIYAATVKEELNQLGGADNLYAEVINIILHRLSEGLSYEEVNFDSPYVELNDAALVKRLFNTAAIVKIKLNQLGGADGIYTKAFSIFGEDLTGEMFNNAAVVKLNLNQFAEAKKLIDKALAIFGENPPAYVLKNVELIEQKSSQSET